MALELTRIACPFCQTVLTLKQMVKHLDKCEHLYDGVLAPPTESIAADQAWFAKHPKSWRLRRRITELEKVAFRAHHGLAADVSISGCVSVLKPYPYNDARSRYSWRGVRVEGVSSDAEGLCH